MLRLLVGVGLTALVLYWSHPSQIIEAALAADLRWIAAAIALVLVDRTLMAMRWIDLLVALTPGTRPPLNVVLRAFFTSSFVSNFTSLDDLKFREIGRGAGSQAFDLGAIGTNAIPVIRLRDLSGVSSAARKPLEAPGAGFTGVGFRLAPEIPPVYDITLDKLTVCATDHITIGSRCHIVGANGKPGIVSNSGLASTIVGPSSQLGTVFSESHIIMGPDCSVDGDVHTEGRFIQQGVRVSGKVHEGEALRLPILRVFSDVQLPAPSQADLTVSGKAVTKLDPGQVGDVHIKSGGRLVLGKGRYVFESLSVESQGQIDVSGANGVVEVYVRGAAQYRGRILTQKDKANLVLVVLGKEGAFVGAPFRGTIVAPNGKLLFDADERASAFVHSKATCPSGIQHVGAFYGKQVIVEAGTTLTHLPA